MHCRVPALGGDCPSTYCCAPIAVHINDAMNDLTEVKLDSEVNIAV